jgi:hypothetical protein
VIVGVGCENSNKMNEVVCKKRKIMKNKKLRATSGRDKCEKKR